MFVLVSFFNKSSIIITNFIIIINKNKKEVLFMDYFNLTFDYDKILLKTFQVLVIIIGSIIVYYFVLFLCIAKAG